MLWLLLLTVLCCYLLHRILQKVPLMYKQNTLIEKIPGPPRDSLIFGNTSDLVSPEEAPAWLLERYKQFGGIFRLWQIWKPSVMISEASYAEVYFNTKSLETKSYRYDSLRVWLGEGLLINKGPSWHQRRKLITPTFHFSILNGFSDIFANNSHTLMQKIRGYQGATVDVFELMHLVSLDNICETAMGIKIDALRNPMLDYIKAVEDAAHTIVNRSMIFWYANDFIFFSLPIGRKLKKDLNTLFALANEAIRNKRNERALKKADKNGIKIDETEGKKKVAFLDCLMDACESDSVNLSDEELKDEVNMFMFAGHDTTATSMSFTLYLLGLHPEIQEKCYQELDDIFQGSDRKPTVDDLRSMKYLEQVIKESLRLFPSAPIISRLVQEDIKMGDYALPEGTTLVMNIYNLHRDPKYFPDPEKFDPDRFLPENSAGRHPYAYVPFAAGPRNCIGQKFALLEEKVILSDVLRNFTMKSNYGREELDILFSLVIRSQKPLDMQFIPRTISPTSVNKIK